MLRVGMFGHAGPDMLAGLWMELSGVPIVPVIDAEGRAFPEEG